MHIFFSGIGGSGIAPLAKICLDLGLKVSGSDRETNKKITDLQSLGAEIIIDESHQSISKINTVNLIDWFVHSSAIDNSHDQLQFATQHNIRKSKRDGLINYIIKEYNLNLIAVSGTHGKTTTTAMLVWVFKQLNIPVSYLIGSDIQFGSASQFIKQSKYFIYECDEFDRNFLNFYPFYSIIVSKDFDHSDTYQTQQKYDDAFLQFIRQSKTVFTHNSILESLNLSQITETHVLTTDDNLSGLTDKLRSLLGNHNKQNAALVFKTITSLEDINKSIPDFSEKILLALNAFPGTLRRCEKIHNNLYSDYAHHPSEIAATLELIREIKNLNYSNNKKIVVVYQPHQNLRQYQPIIQNGYKQCFNQADKVYWLPTYLSREDKSIQVLTPNFLSAMVEKQNIIELVEINHNLFHKIQDHIAAGNLVVIMGAGDIDSKFRNEFVL